MSASPNLIGAALAVFAAAVSTTTFAQKGEPHLKEVLYDPRAVVDVNVKRGVVTHIVLDADESITDVASGQGGDCAKPEAIWCVAAQAGGRHVFVKPKTGASTPNNVEVVTDRRIHSFRLLVLADQDPKPPVYRLTVRAQHQRPTALARTESGGTPEPQPIPPEAPPPAEVVAARLQAAPEVLNASYSLAEGKDSEDIAPTLVFDDGRFTYLRFAGNRPVPAVFEVLADGRETVVNTRVEDDLLVVDRIARKLVLRAGTAVVAAWNDAFDADGVPPARGVTVSGVRRLVRGEAAIEAQDTGAEHE